MRNLILIGFMGAGKTTAGACFARKHHWKLVDTDWLVEEMAGISISDIFRILGEDKFRDYETMVLERLLEEGNEGAVVCTGGGLPLRRENRQMLRRLGQVAYLSVKPATVAKRLEGDQSRPLLQGEGAMGQMEGMLASRQPLYLEAAHFTISVDGKETWEIVKELEEKAGVLDENISD